MVTFLKTLQKTLKYSSQYLGLGFSITFAKIGGYAFPIYGVPKLPYQIYGHHILNSRCGHYLDKTLAL